MTGSKFQLHYFNAQGVAMPIRAMLCIAGADWSQRVQQWDDWAEVKTKTPFGTLPILTETTETGEVVEIPETFAIERYLARKFGMAGSTEAEQIQVDTAFSLYLQLNNFWQQRLLLGGLEGLSLRLEELKTSHVPRWISGCEKMLTKNGSNGHFVGNKVTFADVIASTMMDYMLAVEGMDGVLNERTAPNLFACKHKVDSMPSYYAFRQTDEFTQLNAGMDDYCEPRFGFSMNRGRVVKTEP